MSSTSLEGLKLVFEYGGVLLLFLTFLFGAGLVVTTNRLNRVQARELRDFRLKIEDEQQKTARAQKEAADAQLALKQYVDLMATRLGPRSLDIKRFLKHLRGKPKGVAEIWYKPEDSEAFMFSGQIKRWLGAGVDGDGAGWEVSDPKPIPSGEGDIVTGKDVPSDLKFGSSSGLTVRGNKRAREFGENTAVGALMEALMWGREGGGTIVFIGDSTLPDDHLVIIVGQRQ